MGQEQGDKAPSNPSAWVARATNNALKKGVATMPAQPPMNFSRPMQATLAIQARPQVVQNRMPVRPQVVQNRMPVRPQVRQMSQSPLAASFFAWGVDEDAFALVQNLELYVQRDLLGQLLQAKPRNPSAWLARAVNNYKSTG